RPLVPAPAWSLPVAKDVPPAVAFPGSTQCPCQSGHGPLRRRGCAPWTPGGTTRGWRRSPPPCPRRCGSPARPRSAGRDSGSTPAGSAPRRDGRSSRTRSSSALRVCVFLPAPGRTTAAPNHGSSRRPGPPPRAERCGPPGSPRACAPASPPRVPGTANPCPGCAHPAPMRAWRRSPTPRPSWTCAARRSAPPAAGPGTRPRPSIRPAAAPCGRTSGRTGDRAPAVPTAEVPAPPRCRVRVPACAAVPPWCSRCARTPGSVPVADRALALEGTALLLGFQPPLARGTRRPGRHALARRLPAGFDEGGEPLACVLAITLLGAEALGVDDQHALRGHPPVAAGQQPLAHRLGQGRRAGDVEAQLHRGGDLVDVLATGARRTHETLGDLRLRDVDRLAAHRRDCRHAAGNAA